MLLTDERDAQALYGLGGKVEDASSAKAVEIGQQVGNLCDFGTRGEVLIEGVFANYR